MARTIQQELKTTKREIPFLFEEGSTIKSSGLFDGISAFIPCLTFLSGPALGKEIPLISRQITLGRSADCDITIPDPSVSRKHLRISCRKVVKKGEVPRLKVVARDLGSRNGTLINYAAAQRAVLKPGDKIIVGHVILKYDHRDVAEQNFYEEIYKLATTDSLTSLLNKSSITRTLSEEIAANRRNRRWISVILADIDAFKSLNDLYGHLGGDRILQAVAEVLRTSLRRKDKVGRFGGDEFLLVLPETRLRGACQAAERIREKIENFVKTDLELTTSVTVSLGVAARRTTTAKSEELLESADTALYRAKSLGRNRIEFCKSLKSKAVRL